MSYCFTPSHLLFLSTFTPQEWWCVINLRAVQLHISNPPAWSVWRYWFGFLPTRVMICVCLVWPSDRRDFFKLPFCTRSLVPVHARHPVCHLTSISEGLLRCDGGPKRVAGASETWHEDKGYGSKQTVTVSKPLGQMATVWQGDGQFPRIHTCKSHRNT